MTLSHDRYLNKIQTRDNSVSINVVPTLRVFGTERSLNISLHTRNLQLDIYEIALSHSSLRPGRLDSTQINSDRPIFDRFKFQFSSVRILALIFESPLIRLSLGFSLEYRLGRNCSITPGHGPLPFFSLLLDFSPELLGLVLGVLDPRHQLCSLAFATHPTNLLGSYLQPSFYLHEKTTLSTPASQTGSWFEVFKTCIILVVGSFVQFTE